jgi:hypothetical protein
VLANEISLAETPRGKFVQSFEIDEQQVIIAIDLVI